MHIVKNQVIAKQYINTTILDLQLDTPPKWSDIKHIKFEDDDVIQAGWVEPYYSENNSYEGFYHVMVQRRVLESDEVYNERLISNARLANELQAKRYETFKRLKEEFEPDPVREPDPVAPDDKDSNLILSRSYY